MISWRNSLTPTILCVALALAATTSSVWAFSTSISSRSALSSSSKFMAAATLESSSATEASGSTMPKSSDTAAEEVVRRYFDGVNKKDPSQLRSCFGETATIRDVCGLDSTVRTVDSQILVERCMEFVTAHPDCLVRFHYGPSQERDTEETENVDKNGTWVVAHWYEVGHWSEDSCGIPAPNPPLPMAVEGQTRFRVASEDGEPKIQEFVVTRTFTEWENAMIDKRNQDAKDQADHYIFSSAETETEQLLKSMVITAEKAARAAGKVILDGQESLADGNLESGGTSTTEQKVNIKDIVTKYDKEAQDAIEHIIRSEFPFHSFLGEEDVAAGGDASAQALSDALNGDGDSEYIWIVDPIDGTANFASGLDLCGVTVAVVNKSNGKALMGVIYDPHKDEMFVAVDGKGAYCNEKPIGTTSGASSASLKDAIVNAGCPADPNAFAASMRGVQALNSKCRGLRVIACSALTLAWVASNRLGAHFGYDLSSWDLVAGALLIQEAGGSVTDIDGSDYEVATRNMLVSSPDSNAGDGSVHGEILAVLTEADAISFERAD